MGTLNLQSNELLYSNTVIGTLAVDGWAVTFGTAQRGLQLHSMWQSIITYALQRVKSVLITTDLNYLTQLKSLSLFSHLFRGAL